MVEADVASSGDKFFVGQLSPTRESEAVGASDGDVTRSVLVEERVVEKMPAFADGRGCVDQRHFAEPRRAFVGVHQFLQEGFVLFRVHFHDATVLERHAEIFDETSAITEWERRGDSSLRAMTIGQCENFFGGHVGGEDDPVLRQGLRAAPDMSVWQAESEVGAGTFVMQSGIFFRLHVVGARFQVFDMCFPCGDWVGERGARRFKDGLP